MSLFFIKQHIVAKTCQLSLPETNSVAATVTCCYALLISSMNIKSNQIKLTILKCA